MHSGLLIYIPRTVAALSAPDRSRLIANESCSLPGNETSSPLYQDPPTVSSYTLMPAANSGSVTAIVIRSNPVSQHVRHLVRGVQQLRSHVQHAGVLVAKRHACWTTVSPGWQRLHVVSGAFRDIANARLSSRLSLQQVFESCLCRLHAVLQK